MASFVEISRQISLKINCFGSDLTIIFTFFLTKIIICSFNNNTLKKRANGNAFNMITTAAT